MNNKLNYTISTSDVGAMKAWEEIAKEHGRDLAHRGQHALSTIWSHQQSAAQQPGEDGPKYITIEFFESSLAKGDFINDELMQEVAEFEFPFPYGTILFGFDVGSNRRFAISTGRLGNIILIDWDRKIHVAVGVVAKKLSLLAGDASVALTYDSAIRLLNLNKNLEVFLVDVHNQAKEITDEEEGVLRAEHEDGNTSASDQN